MAAGNNDLKNVALPTAWDNAELRRLQLRDGATYESVVRDIDDALSIVNSSLTDGYLGGLFSLTTEPAIEYRDGFSTGFGDHTEYSQPDAQRADTSGHMLPIKKQDRKLGWTKDFLEEARRAKIDADIASVVQDARDAFEKSVLTRLFKYEEETGKRYGLGASGYSVPFVDGGGQTIDFTPLPRPDRMINAFSTSHNHYLRLDGITQVNLETAVGHLWEHGHDGPFDLVIPLADIGSWQNTSNVTGFVERADPLIQYGNNTSLASVGDVYIGGVKTKYGFCRMYANGRIPTAYWSVIKTYGGGDQRNPLKVRYDELFGFGVKLEVDNVALMPLTGAIATMKFGVGVGMDRTAAVLVENDSSGSYATPTIS